MLNKSCKRSGVSRVERVVYNPSTVGVLSQHRCEGLREATGQAWDGLSWRQSGGFWEGCRTFLCWSLYACPFFSYLCCIVLCYSNMLLIFFSIPYCLNVAFSGIVWDSCFPFFFDLDLIPSQCFCTQALISDSPLLISCHLHSFSPPLLWKSKSLPIFLLPVIVTFPAFSHLPVSCLAISLIYIFFFSFVILSDCVCLSSSRHSCWIWSTYSVVSPLLLFLLSNPAQIVAHHPPNLHPIPVRAPQRTTLFCM